jgi:hypothetical protein
MCVITRLAHIMNSTTKSRSPTPQRLFSHIERNPSSFAKNSRSSRNGLPASAPEPKGKTETLGMSCRKRCRSDRNEKAWESRRCDQRIGRARYQFDVSQHVEIDGRPCTCKCVYPGSRTSISVLARSAITEMSSDRCLSRCLISPRSHKRMSVAT